MYWCEGYMEFNWDSRQCCSQRSASSAPLPQGPRGSVIRMSDWHSEGAEYKDPYGIISCSRFLSITCINYLTVQTLFLLLQISESDLKLWWDDFMTEFFHENATLAIEVDLGDGMRKFCELVKLWRWGGAVVHIFRNDACLWKPFPLLCRISATKELLNT